jgi:hypothetical protein
MKSRTLIGIGALVLTPFLAGCAPGQGKVSGQLTYNNKPVPGGLITFRPADPKQNSVSAELDAEGRFTAIVPEGEVLVSIDNRELEPRPTNLPSIPPDLPLSPEARAKIGKIAPPKPAEGDAKESDEVRRPRGRYLPIPEKYYLGETSGLKFTIKAGDQTLNIELTD